MPCARRIRSRRSPTRSRSPARASASPRRPISAPRVIPASRSTERRSGSRPTPHGASTNCPAATTPWSTCPTASRRFCWKWLSRCSAVILGGAWSLRRQSGLLDDTSGSGAILDQEAGKFLRRVQDRLQRAVEELRLAEGGLVADADHVFPDLVDDRLGRARRRKQAEIDAGEIAAIAELRQRWNIREQRRALGAVDRQTRHRAALQMGDEVLQAEERDRRRPRQHGVGGVAAAAEGDGDPVGTALAFELFEVERQRKRRRGIA